MRFLTPLIFLILGSAHAIAALKVPCYKLLEGDEKTVTYQLGDELEATHPAVRLIAKNLNHLTYPKRSPHRNFIDVVRFQIFITQINSELPGKFQIYPYNGEFHLVYVENNQVYFLNMNVRGSRILLTKRVPMGLDGFRSRAKRFVRPRGMVLVGLERGYDGAIIPMFSDSSSLSEFRDLRKYKSNFLSGFDPEAHSRLPRFVKEVPLFPIKSEGIVHLKPEDLQILPVDVRELLTSGHTLTTIPSLRGIAEKYQSPELYARFQNYSALIIADEHGQGRTGILLNEGIPVLVSVEGKEYFIEIKGVGLATQAPIAEMVHPRGHFRIRLGRASIEQVHREFEGYSVFRQNSSDGSELSRPIAGVALPEFSDREKEYLGDKDESDDLSGQIFRLAFSSRRLAYTDNPAYGVDYSDRPKLLRMAQEYYGRVLARLRLLSPGQAFMHNSPHPQNLIYDPLTDQFSLTDFSDIHKVEGYDVMRMELPDIDQFLVFKNRESRSALLRGIRSELEPRGLWTPAMQALEGKLFSQKHLTDGIVSELLIRFLLESENGQAIRDCLIPRFYKASYHLTEILEGDGHAVSNQPHFLEIAFRLNINHLVQVENSLRRIEGSRSLAPQFSEFQNQATAARARVTRLIQDARSLYNREASKGDDAWTGPVVGYATQMQAIHQREAAIYDTITEYRSADTPTNLTMAQGTSLAQWLSNQQSISF